MCSVTSSFVASLFNSVVGEGPRLPNLRFCLLARAIFSVDKPVGLLWLLQMWRLVGTMRPHDALHNTDADSVPIKKSPAVDDLI